MSRNFYSFEDIAKNGDCLRFASEVLGLKVADGRCRAAWRGGDNDTAVSLTRDKWFDHRDGKGGGLLQLCAVAKFAGDIQAAQEFLGDWLGLQPKITAKPRRPRYARYNQLIAEGYREARRYVYTDADGNEAHVTIRLEKEGEKKKFVQQSPGSDNLDGVKTYLYRLPEVLRADTVYVAEGEKDAETLVSFGLCGTTAPMGARKWQPGYTEALTGRHVVIVRDRDTAGLAHARLVAESVIGKAASVKVVCAWKKAKDVTEWVEIEHGDASKFADAVDKAQFVEDASLLADKDALAVLLAKELNHDAFRNYTSEDVGEGRRRRTVFTARKVNELVGELFERFLGFPRRLGDNTLFDFDRDTDAVVSFGCADELFAWVGRKSNQIYDWRGKLDGAVTKPEFFRAVMQSAYKYEAIAKVPMWPSRNDVFYAFRDECKPTAGHAALNGFLRFFSPANDYSATLLRVFASAPLYFRPGIQRPIWVVDSADGAGVGKTTLVELVALLYRCHPIRTNLRQLRMDYQEVLKNVLSATGRESRVFLIDNATGDVDCDAFADMTTASALSGRPSYGRGEESRPNDLTYCVTANNASLSDDIASRSFCIMLSRPRQSMAEWKREVIRYVEKNRYAILGDIIDILSEGASFEAVPRTRFAEFEREVVMPMCGGFEAYDIIMRGMAEQRDESNIDIDQARQVEETVEANLVDAGVSSPATSVVFVRCEAMRTWLHNIHVSAAEVQGFIKSGKATAFAKGDVFQQFPRSRYQEARYGIRRARGFMWIGANVDADGFLGVQVVGRTSKDKFGVVNKVSFTASADYGPVVDELNRRAETIPDATVDTGLPPHPMTGDDIEKIF